MRREFIGLVGATAVTWPSAARSQDFARNIPRIGVLWHAANEDQAYLAPFRQGLNDIGYESKNTALEDRFAAEHECFDGLAAEQVKLKVDVLVAVTQPAALAAQRAMTTIPVVFVLAQKS